MNAPKAAAHRSIQRPSTYRRRSPSTSPRYLPIAGRRRLSDLLDGLRSSEAEVTVEWQDAGTMMPRSGQTLCSESTQRSVHLLDLRRGSESTACGRTDKPGSNSSRNTKEHAMTAEPIDPAATSLLPTQPIDITDCLPTPREEPTA
jgi:hypothetical protein